MLGQALKVHIVLLGEREQIQNVSLVEPHINLFDS